MTTQEPVRVGLIGCGAISEVYLKNAAKFPILKVVACADLDSAKAVQRSKQHKGSRVSQPEEIFADPEIELILNLTIPSAHAEVAAEAIAGGKNVYGEKPLAVNWDEGQQLIEVAEKEGVRIGSAPDTFLGQSHQTARQLIDDGAIGRPLAATAFMLSSGVETWHPNPEFYYKPGGGPMFDMGPYYLTALVNLLGAVRRVAGMARINMPHRRITSEPLKGTLIEVEVPTHVASVLEFHSGAIATLVTSFDVKATTTPNIEIYGAEASMIVPDPNTFGGDVMLRGAGDKKWRVAKPVHRYGDNWRGVGLADMATAIRSGRKHRADGALALHVLEIMHAIHVANDEQRHVDITTRPDRPEPMLTGLKEGNLEA